VEGYKEKKMIQFFKNNFLLLLTWYKTIDLNYHIKKPKKKSVSQNGIWSLSKIFLMIWNWCCWFLVGGFDWFFFIFEKFSFPQLRRWLTLLMFNFLFNIWFLVMLWKRLKTFSFHHLHHHPLRYLRRHRTSRGSNCHAKVAWSVWNPYSCPHSKYPAQQWRHRMPF